jgi:uncharacterized protein (DUF1501 family)
MGELGRLLGRINFATALVANQLAGGKVKPDLIASADARRAFTQIAGVEPSPELVTAIDKSLDEGAASSRPGHRSGAIDLDGRFALHPSLQPLKALYDGGQLAIVHAAGSPDPSRSHFNTQEFMESGTAGVKTEDGWLNRALPLVSSNVSPMRAIALGTQLPRTLRGNPDAAAIVQHVYASSSDVRSVRLLAGQ